MRILSMAVAALIAMMAGALAEQKTAKDAVPKFPSKDYEIIVPNGWSAVTYEEVDSPCIGDSTVPKCVVETEIACALLYETIPCGGKVEKADTRKYFLLYRILLVEPIRKSRYFWQPQYGNGRGGYRWKAELGDMHFVVVETACHSKFQRGVGHICDKQAKRHYFIRQQADGNWELAKIVNF
jgi:hypothetical protein